MKKRLTRLIAVILPITSMNGCNIDIPLKDESVVAQQRELFNQLCNAKERSIVYQTAKADGYLSASDGGNLCLEGWDPIFEYGYQYAECTTTKLTSQVLPDNAEIYRFTLEPENHPDCGTGEKRLVDYSRRTYHGDSPSYKETNYINNYKKQHKDKLEGQCLVVKQVSEPMSRFILLDERIYIDDGKEYSKDSVDKEYGGNHDAVIKEKGLITAERISLIDMTTGKYLSRYSNYSFFPKSMVHVTSHTVRCEGGSVSIKPNEVLVPRNSQ